MFLTTLSIIIGTAIAPAAFAQDSANKPPLKDKPAVQKDAPPKTDVLDDLFEKAEDEIKNGEHCDPRPKETPIA